jgi:succinate-acetate transporter protein
MTPRFKKVVEYENFYWQKSDWDFSHIASCFIFLSALFLIIVIASLISNNSISFVIGFIGFILSILLILIKKRKVYWEKME